MPDTNSRQVLSQFISKHVAVNNLLKVIQFCMTLNSSNSRQEFFHVTVNWLARSLAENGQRSIWEWQVFIDSKILQSKAKHEIK